VDEGHVIKNPKNKLPIALHKVLTKRRLLLSGTPIQNNLMEYYHMVDWVRPGLLGTPTEFTEKFYTPIDQGQSSDITLNLTLILTFNPNPNPNPNPIDQGQNQNSSDDEKKRAKDREYVLHSMLGA